MRKVIKELREIYSEKLDKLEKRIEKLEAEAEKTKRKLWGYENGFIIATNTAEWIKRLQIEVEKYENLYAAVLRVAERYENKLSAIEENIEKWKKGEKHTEEICQKIHNILEEKEEER